MKFIKNIYPLKVSAFLSVIILVFTASSCEKVSPTVCISHSASFDTNFIYRVGLDIQFNDCSLNATSYYWDFGDGSTSTGKNVWHTYTNAGNYTVTHKVYSEDGNSSDVTSIEITVTPVLQGYRFNKIVINKFDPVDKYGSAWDNPDDGPDISFFIQKGWAGMLLDYTNTLSNCQENNSYSVDLSYYHQIFDLNQEYFFIIFDEDNGSYSLMQAIEFNLYSLQYTMYDGILRLEQDGYEIEIHGEWIY